MSKIEDVREMTLKEKMTAVSALKVGGIIIKRKVRYQVTHINKCYYVRMKLCKEQCPGLHEQQQKNCALLPMPHKHFR